MTKKKQTSIKKKSATRRIARIPTRRTSKAKSVKPVKKQRKPKNDINSEIDRILAGMYEPKTTKRKTPISKPKRTRKLSMKELERKIDKMVREALKQKPKKEKKP